MGVSKITKKLSQKITIKMGVSKITKKSYQKLFDIFKVHHKKLSRTKMLPLRKKISDLKNRPLNWDRVPYVLSKNEYFLSTWGDIMSRKNDPKKSE